MLYRSLGVVEAVASDDPDLVPALEAAVRALAAQSPRPVALAFVSDEEMRGLNLRFRGLDAPTDVLTFATGDVAIGVGSLRRQAAWRGVSTADEAALLALHAALHLEGYDDVEDEDRAAMQRETKRRADALGIPCEAEWVSLPHDEEALV